MVVLFIIVDVVEVIVETLLNIVELADMTKVVEDATVDRLLEAVVVLTFKPN